LKDVANGKDVVGAKAVGPEVSSEAP
jgi:hypothetical protein